MYVKEQAEKCFNTFKPYFSKSIFLDYKIYQKYIIEKAKENDFENKKFYLEFGVWVGTTINFFSKYVNTIYGFDSFEGLKEDWKGTQATKGTFNLNGKIPSLNKNVSPIKGWIQDTLPIFLKRSENINFVHIDVDTYNTSNFILKTIKPFLNNGAIILFDELYNCIGWEENEYKALIENFNEKEYDYLAFSKEGSQVLIKYIKK
jgi:hypothetical protein